MNRSWIAARADQIDSSGIRKVFDLAGQMTDPVNLSIGQPDFDVPEPVKEEMIAAVRSGKNAYALTQGMPVLRETLQARIDQELGHADRKVMITSGTSGGLLLAMMSLVNPGDEVIFFDPYFVMYPPHTLLCGGTPVPISTYPDFRIDANRLEAAITDKTKAIILNSPANPTGVAAGEAEVQAVAEIAARHNLALLSDEIYRSFLYEGDFTSPAPLYERTLVIDGFSKSHAMTGWRLGFAHGPREIIDTMIKLQQYTFVCAPQPVQWAGAVALEVDMSPHVEAYRRKRDLLCDGIGEFYELTRPSGAFYVFPKAPRGSGSEFVAEAIRNNLLIIPGNIFSERDTHFRVSYAAPDATIERGVEILRSLAS